MYTQRQKLSTTQSQSICTPAHTDTFTKRTNG